MIKNFVMVFADIVPKALGESQQRHTPKIKLPFILFFYCFT